MKPCHLFRRGGTCFVYHVAAGRFIRTDPAAYEYLRLRSALPKPEAESRFLAAFPERKDVLSDCGKLEAEDDAVTFIPGDGDHLREWPRLAFGE